MEPWKLKASDLEARICSQLLWSLGVLDLTMVVQFRASENQIYVQVSRLRASNVQPSDPEVWICVQVQCFRVAAKLSQSGFAHRRNVVEPRNV